MNQVAFQRTLMQLTDALAGLPEVRLKALHPHQAARDSFVADVDCGAGQPDIELRALSEQIYHDSGVLVLFQSSG